ncbi:MAG: VWA domain-containing protein [Phycisphaerales bacterium]|nr:VWA domain-containing protein [Phycisphaerales bacterium]
MNELLSRLLNSPSLRLGQEGVELGFVHELPPWAWALIILGAALFGWLGYRRLEGSVSARATLGTLRGLVILLIAVLICQPRLAKLSETIEKDWVLVLVDRSASLSVADASGPAGTRPEPREQQLRSLLESAAPTFRQLGAERVLVWLGFDASAYELPVSRETGTPSLAEPTGRRTDLNRAIEQALRKSAARPLAGVVLFSDGRAVEPPARSLLRRLEAEKVPIFTVALGSPTSLPDLSVRRVEAPRTGFVKDAVPVQVELERSGPPVAPGETAVVELVDEATGTVMDSRPLVWDEGGAEGGVGGGNSGEQVKRLTLRSTAAIAGSGKWNVRIRPAPGSPGDMVDSTTPPSSPSTCSTAPCASRTSTAIRDGSIATSRTCWCARSRSPRSSCSWPPAAAISRKAPSSSTACPAPPRSGPSSTWSSWATSGPAYSHASSSSCSSSASVSPARA